MPESPTANMGLILPTEDGDADVWDTLLAAVFTLIDEHDHTTGKGVPVPSAGLRINADVAWSYSGTNYAITALKALDFTPLAATAMTSYSSALFANSSDSNNLYYRNSSGTNVKITDGSTLNVSIVGGIGGDYSSVSALLDYDDASDTYRFRQETSASVRQYAKVSIADLIIREYDPAGDATVPSNTITIKSPDALAASYSLTLPDAVPASSTLFLQSTTSGVLSWSNTTTQVVTAATFKNSTADTIAINAMEAVDVNGTHTKATSAIGAQKGWTLAASTNKIAYPIRLPVGARITSYAVWLEKNTNGSATVTARIYATRTSTLGTESAQGSGNSSSLNAPGFIQLTETGLSIDITAGFEYYVVLTPSGSVTSSADVLYSAEVSYTRP